MALLDKLGKFRKQLAQKKEEIERRGNSDGIHGTSSMLSNESMVGNRTAPGAFDLSSFHTSIDNKENSILNGSIAPRPPLSSFKTPMSRTSGLAARPTPIQSTSIKRRSKSATGFAPMTPISNNSSMIAQTPSSLRSYNSVASLVSPNQSIFVNGNEYRQIRLLGKGGSCKVYECLDDQNEPCAVKVVELPDDEDAAKAFKNEVELLHSLQGTDHVIRMFEYELRDDLKLLYVVLEKGDVDFNESLKERFKKKKIDLTFLKFYWKEMLKCVKVIHDRQIVHADLKPANFLVVKNNLKLIDFGIASSIPSNETSILKDNPNGTLSYMAPETLSPQNCMPGGKFKLPLKSDVWSLGCILYQMVYGQLPFSNARGNQMKMYAITDPNHSIEYPETRYQTMVDIMKRCLERDLAKRATVDELLETLALDEDEKQKNTSDVSGDMNTKLQAILTGPNTPNTKLNKLQQVLNQTASRNGGSTAGDRKLEFD